MRDVSVTEALQLVYPLAHVPAAVLERKAEIGKAVHEWIERDLKADTDENQFGEFDRPAGVSDEVAGYIEAWKACKQQIPGTRIEAQNVVYISEGEVRNAGLCLVGHPDMLVRGSGGKTILVDVKCVAKQNNDFYRLQLAAYQFLVGEDKVDKRVVLYLKPSGEFTWSEIKTPYHTDAADFLAVLRAFRLREALK